MSHLLQTFLHTKSIGGLSTQADYDELFLSAVEKSDYALCEELLMYGANINAVTKEPLHAFEIAINKNDARMIHFLLDHGASSERILGDNDTTPLHACLIKKAHSCALVLINRGCNTTACRKNNESALHLAARYGEPDILQLLLSTKAKSLINHSTDRYDITPLFAAIYNGNFTCVDMLLRHGALVNVRNAQHETPLGSAIRLDLHDIAVLILNNGADVTRPAGKEDELPLHLAIVHKRYNIAKELILHGADPTHQDPAGRNALWLAAREGNTDLLEFMLDHLPPKCFAQIDYVHGLYDAVFYNHPTTLDIFLKSGRVDIDLRTAFNRSALEAAVDNNNITIAEKLLTAGAKANTQHSNGQSLVDVAQKRGFADMVQVLQKASSC